MEKKLIKPAMVACAEELLGKEAASVLDKIPLSRMTETRRLDEKSKYVEKKIVKILQNTNFSMQINETTIHNQALLLSYVRFVYQTDIREEILFIRNLPMKK